MKPAKLKREPALDVAASRGLARRIRARPRECWGNAGMAVLEDLPRTARLVEGIAVDRRCGFPYPFAHGWVRMGSRILDPTLVLHGDPAPDDITFYPVAEYTWRQLAERCLAEERWGPSPAQWPAINDEELRVWKLLGCGVERHTAAQAAAGED